MNEAKTIAYKLYRESLCQKKSTLIFIIIFGFLCGFSASFCIPHMSEKIQLLVVSMITIVILKQWSAESFAAEKENRTFESILSTTLDLSKLYWVEVIYNLILAIIIEVILIILFKISNVYLNVETAFIDLDLFMLMILLLQLQIFMGITATYISLTSADVRTSGSRSAKILYLIMLFISIIVSLKINNTPYLVYIYIVLILFMLIINIITIKYKQYKLKTIRYEDILN